MGIYVPPGPGPEYQWTPSLAEPLELEPDVSEPFLMLNVCRRPDASELAPVHQRLTATDVYGEELCQSFESLTGIGCICVTDKEAEGYSKLAQAESLRLYLMFLRKADDDNRGVDNLVGRQYSDKVYTVPSGGVRFIELAHATGTRFALDMPTKGEDLWRRAGLSDYHLVTDVYDLIDGRWVFRFYHVCWAKSVYDAREACIVENISELKKAMFSIEAPSDLEPAGLP